MGGAGKEQGQGNGQGQGIECNHTIEAVTHLALDSVMLR